MNLVRIMQQRALLMGQNAEIVDVVMVGESAFPYVRGGVSGVMNQMFRGLPDVTFGIISIAWDRKDTKCIRYEIPPNVRWISNIYLSPEEFTGSTPARRALERVLRACAPCSVIPCRKVPLAKSIFDYLAAASQGEFTGLFDLYRNFLDPRTRLHSPARVFRSRDFLLEFENYCARNRLPLTEAFWVWQNFTSAVTRIACAKIPDGRVYHAQTQLYAGFAAALGAIQNDRPFILTEHSLNIRDSVNFVLESDMKASRKRLWTEWFRHLGKFVYARADHATYQFDRNINEATELGLDRDKVITISNGVKLDDFAEARMMRASETSTRTAKGWYSVPWRIAYTGRIVEAKGILDLIEAAMILRSRDTIPFTLQLIGPLEGSRSFKNKCEKIIRRLGLADLVSFPGSLDLRIALGTVDIMVLPSHADALPIVMLEAMASSVPVVATDVGAIDEVLRAPVSRELMGEGNGDAIGDAGIVIPPRSPGAIADAITRLAIDRDFYESCRRNGPRRIEINHRAEDIMEKYLDLYNIACFRQNPRYSGRDVTRRAYATTGGNTVATDRKDKILKTSNAGTGPLYP